MVLINLSYIPDEVAHKINFKPGWSVEFKKNMEQYKKQFYEKHKVKWEFQNSRLENDYVDYIFKMEKKDEQLQARWAADEKDERYHGFVNRVYKHREVSAKPKLSKMTTKKNMTSIN